LGKPSRKAKENEMKNGEKMKNEVTPFKGGKLTWRRQNVESCYVESVVRR